jgi:acyl carrier protein phosphodiesterase
VNEGSPFALFFKKMNYLAHAYLSGNDPALLVGNFIADHVRGAAIRNYPEKIMSGIILHREIDTYTDQHKTFRTSKRLFYDGYERYSGILIDIYFDYFLAKNFDRYSGISLTEFSERAYQLYKAHEYLLPEQSSRFLDYVLKNNVYQSYSGIEAIERVLSHLSLRIGHGVRLEGSIPVFKMHEEHLQNNFTSFFEDLTTRFLKDKDQLRIQKF